MTLRNAFDALGTETTLAGILAKLPVLQGGAAPVTFTWSGLTDEQLRAAAVPVSGTFWQATQPVSVSTLPLPSGAASEASLAALLAALKPEDSPAISGDPGLPILAMRQISDTTSTDNDGDYTLIKIDEEGRVKVATKPASFILISGSITAAAQTVFCDVSRASNVMIAMVATSLVGHNATFEGSIDSTNGTDGSWFGIQVIRSNANTTELATGVLSATPGYAWEASVNGMSFIRVRATAHTSGTAQWKFQRGSYATEPIPAAQVSATQPVSGTVTANVAGAGITGGTISPLTVAGVSIEASSAKTATGNSAAAITNASGNGVLLFLNITAVSGTTPTLDLKVQVQDPVSSLWFDVPGASFAQRTATGTGILCIMPGVVEAANSKVSYPLPRTYRLAWTIGGTTPSFTFSVGAQYII